MSFPSLTSLTILRAMMAPEGQESSEFIPPEATQEQEAPSFKHQLSGEAGGYMVSLPLAVQGSGVLSPGATPNYMGGSIGGSYTYDPLNSRPSLSLVANVTDGFHFTFGDGSKVFYSDEARGGDSTTYLAANMQLGLGTVVGEGDDERRQCVLVMGRDYLAANLASDAVAGAAAMPETYWNLDVVGWQEGPTASTALGVKVDCQVAEAINLQVFGRDDVDHQLLTGLRTSLSLGNFVISGDGLLLTSPWGHIKGNLGQSTVFWGLSLLGNWDLVNSKAKETWQEFNLSSGIAGVGIHGPADSVRRLPNGKNLNLMGRSATYFVGGTLAVTGNRDLYGRLSGGLYIFENALEANIYAGEDLVNRELGGYLGLDGGVSLFSLEREGVAKNEEGKPDSQRQSAFSMNTFITGQYHHGEGFYLGLGLSLELGGVISF